MNEDSRAIAESVDYATGSYSSAEARLAPQIPEYLQDTYWWAYLHPKALHFFEREWVVNLILWGNMRKLTQAVLDEMSPPPRSKVLQVACVYGEFSRLLASHLDGNGSRLELVDVAPIQIRNAREKLSGHDNVGYHHLDSTDMSFPAASFEQTVVFFLLHEQPEEARRDTIAEAIRVTRPGGKVIFVDYHGPRRSNPFRYVMRPILTLLEPFAMDLWREELPRFMPSNIEPGQIRSQFYFGGLYQKIVVSV
ncbi:MAG: rhodoquinone biosynthesis methyltransferase RquA [Lysobacterales bacterium]|jgi:ubiquinone/menaquinone biosynthesis C-methylase UbiE